MHFLTGHSDDDWLQRVGRAVTTPARGRLGPYEMIAEVSRGGQGVVFRARQPGTSREVALKRLIAGRFATPEALARFDREVRSAAALNHPNIVTVFGLESIDHQPVIAMEWIDGLPIDRWAPGQPRAALLACFLQVCDAIQHAHQHGVIHRDLKPGNILVDQAGAPHVLDFGLAKLTRPDDSAAARLTVSHEFLGTPAYAAPEQLRSADGGIDTRSDVYSLGAVLYELLTGRTPHPTDAGLAALLRAVESSNPVRPSQLSNTCDRELELIVLKALARDPAERYQSVDALAGDLRAYLRGAPIAAHPPSALYQLRALVRRHRAAFAGVAALLLLSTAFGVLSTWQAFSLERQRQRAETARQQQADARAAAEAVSDFFHGMLVAARPETAQGESISVSELVDQAIERLVASPIERPQVEAAVRLTLGQTLYALGRHAEAVTQLERSLELSRDLYGETHPDVAGALVSLGHVERVRDNPHAAIDLYEAGIAIYAALGPDLTIERAQAMSSLAQVHLVLPDLEQAERLLSAARELYDQVPDTSLLADLEVAQMLSALQFERGRSAEAEQTMRDALERAGDAFGAGHDLIIGLSGNLAVLLRRQGRHEEALPFSQRAATSAAAVYGPDDLRTLRLLSNYALVLQKSERYPQAEQAYLDALAGLERTVGADHSVAISAAGNLGSLWTHLGQLEQAETLLRETLERARRTHGPRHPVAALTLGSLAQTVHAAGGPDAVADAAALYREALEIFETALSPDHPFAARARADLAALVGLEPQASLAP